MNDVHYPFGTKPHEPDAPSRKIIVIKRVGLFFAALLFAFGVTLGLLTIKDEAGMGIDAIFGVQKAEFRTLHTYHTMPNGETHIINYNNRLTVIDVSPEVRPLIEYLQKNNIKTIDTVVISHLHLDHYEGMYKLVDSGYKVKRVITNMPDLSVCTQDCCCATENILKLYTYLKEKNIPLEQIKPEETFAFGKDISLKTLYFNTNVYWGNMNATSIVMKLQYPQGCVLMTGDLDDRTGDYLVTNKYPLECNILKGPHHGTGIMPSVAFFEDVHPKEIVIPGSANLWARSPNTPVRKFLAAHLDVKSYVVGEKGDFVLQLL